LTSDKNDPKPIEEALKKAQTNLSPQILSDASELRNQSEPTLRPVSTGIESLLHTPFAVLDHGFIRIVDYMGDDGAVVQAARVSTGKGTRAVNTDQGLINYLLRNRHSTPFEMCEIKMHVKLPIFVARQWIRHRTANVNEISARYSILDREFYIPEQDHLAAQSTDLKQGRADQPLSEEQATRVQNLLRDDALHVYNNYEVLLNNDAEGNVLDENKDGIARELARMNLSLNFYTQWYWKIDLHNLLGFLALRTDSHAQYEIRAYADVLLEIVRQWVPLVYNSFEKYRVGGAALSAGGKEAITRMLKGEHVEREDVGMSAGEWREFKATFEIE